VLAAHSRYNCTSRGLKRDPDRVIVTDRHADDGDDDGVAPVAGPVISGDD